MSFLATLASEPGNGLAALSIELPNWITPTIAGLTVGAIVGVVGFVVVLLLVGRERKPQRRMVAAPLRGAGSGPDNVVFIPPYTTLPRDTPVPPPWMGQHPSTPPSAFPAAAPAAPPSPYPVGASGSFPVAPNRGAPPLRPSTELSARVFAKMGYAVDAPPQTLRSEPPPNVGTALDFERPASNDRPNADPEVELDESELQPDEELAVNHPVMVAPVMMVSSPPPQETLVMSSSMFSTAATQQQQHPSAPPPAPPPVIARRSSRSSIPPQPPAQLVREITPANGVASAEKSAPHPLGVIAASSSAMRMKAASVADLDLDDDNAKTQLVASAFEAQPKRGASVADLDLEDNGATQISETIFDEPPQPRRRSDPPKIRPKAPSPPRFPSAQDAAATKPMRPRAGSGASLPRVTTPPPGRVRQA